MFKFDAEGSVSHQKIKRLIVTDGALHAFVSAGLQKCLEVLCNHSQQDMEKRDKCNRTIHDVATDDCKDLLENLGEYKLSDGALYKYVWFLSGLVIMSPKYLNSSYTKFNTPLILVYCSNLLIMIVESFCPIDSIIIAFVIVEP